MDEALRAGGVLEDDLVTAIQGNDIIVSCLLDYPTIHSVLSTLPRGVLGGKTLLSLTNGTPSQAEEMAAWTKTLGVASYFEGAIVATPQMVGGPQSLLFVSGETVDTFSDIANLLSCIGNPQYLGEQASAAARHDLAALSTMCGMFSGAFLGMALLKEEDSDFKLAPAVSRTLIPFVMALVPHLGLIAKSWDDESWDDNLGKSIGTQLAAVENVLRACREDGLDAGVLEYFARLMKRAVDERGADGGVAVLGTYLTD
jgi:hypothetical protein